MSLLLLGKSVCPICHRVITEDESPLSFPPFVWNQADPLLEFNDASMHRECFERHPLRDQVLHAVEEMRSRTAPGRRRCPVCRQEITDPNDYLVIPRVAVMPNEPLAEYNFRTVHRSHIASWSDLPKLLELLHALKTSGKWVGPALQNLIRELETASST